MMNFSPCFGYPYYRNPQSFLHNSNNKHFSNSKKEHIINDCPNTYKQSNNFTSTTNYNTVNNNNSSVFTNPTINSSNTNLYEYEEFINIFGFKLYFDDLLILALLFFLYKQEIKDDSLYIILILLLLT